MFARRRRHTKSRTGIKTSGKAGGFDENGRYAAIFCFMRAGDMFYVLYSAHKLTNTGENGMLKTRVFCFMEKRDEYVESEYYFPDRRQPKTACD